MTETFRLCNERERKNYCTLKANLSADRPFIKDSDVNNIVSHVLKHRLPFDHVFNWKTYFKHMVIHVLPCVKNRMKKRKDEDYKKIKQFENGRKRYYKELDIVRIIRAIRISKVLQWNVLHTRQRLLLQMQRVQVISSDSSDVSQDDFGQDVRNLSHKEPGVKLFQMGKVAQILRSYSNDKMPIDSLDKRLVKGFYTNDQWELEHDCLEKHQGDANTKYQVQTTLNFDTKNSFQYTDIQSELYTDDDLTCEKVYKTAKT